MLTREKEKRISKPKVRYGQAYQISFAFIIAGDLEYYEPKNYSEACSSKDSNLWLDAMKKKLKSFDTSKFL